MPRDRDDAHPQHDFDGKDLLEPELFAYLNAEYPDDDPASDGRSWPFPWIALTVALAFLVYILGNVYTFLTWPSLGFLHTSRELKKDELVQELQTAVVEIRAIESLASTRERRGTGFNIDSEGLIVTNRHITEDAQLLIVSFPQGGVYQVAEWVEHPSVDLALIRLHAHELPQVRPQFVGLPEVGDDVLIIGHPLGFPLVAIEGEVTNFGRARGQSGVIMEIAAPIHQGSSGSPVFNQQGHVVAVIYATATVNQPDDQRGLAIPIGRITDLLRDNE